MNTILVYMLSLPNVTHNNTNRGLQPKPPNKYFVLLSKCMPMRSSGPIVHE
jgi:hypothetical protein